MDPRLLRLVAGERARELREAAREAARARPRLPPPSPVRLHAAVTIRYAFPDDSGPLGRLASLDSATVPPAPVLLAEVEGGLRAALSLATGELVADPFHPSEALVELLGARARQLTTIGRGGRVGRWTIRVPALRARRSF